MGVSKTYSHSLVDCCSCSAYVRAGHYVTCPLACIVLFPFQAMALTVIWGRRAPRRARPETQSASVVSVQLKIYQNGEVQFARSPMRQRKVSLCSMPSARPCNSLQKPLKSMFILFMSSPIQQATTCATVRTVC